MKLVENWWRQMWRLWSIRLGALASIGIGWIAAYPKDWQLVVDQLPERWRPVIGAAAFAAIAFSRMAKQGEKHD